MSGFEFDSFLHTESSTASTNNGAADAIGNSAASQETVICEMNDSANSISSKNHNNVNGQRVSGNEEQQEAQQVSRHSQLMQRDDDVILDEAPVPPQPQPHDIIANSEQQTQGNTRTHSHTNRTEENTQHSNQEQDDNIPTIKPISSTAIQQIVAGQAITDLSSAVKELVDNAIDAKATRVCGELVEIRSLDCCIA
jgi:hypothetical protein